MSLVKEKSSGFDLRKKIKKEFSSFGVYLNNCLLYVFFGEMSTQSLCPFLDWVIYCLLLNCRSFL